MDKTKIETAVRLFLEGIGENPEREGLQETPARISAMCEELFGGLQDDAKIHLSKRFTAKDNEIVMEKDIVRDMSANEQPKMLVENAEIGMLYTAAFAIYLIAQDAERRMNSKGSSMGFERKMLFNGIIKDLQGAKKKQDRLYEDYIKAWKDKVENYDEEQENASVLAKLLMLWYDRVQGYADREKAVIETIQQLWPSEIVSDSDINRFEMRK